MTIAREVRRVANLLKERRQKIVFAESCTGGLAAGSLAKIPGISEYHCGGMVVYRNPTKIAYLGIPAEILDRPGPVSRQTTERMAEEVLKRTPEADLAAAVTGHLGPHAPQSLDGVVYLCIALRSTKSDPFAMTVKRVKYLPGTSRVARQRQAVEDLLRLVGDVLSAK